MIVLVALVPHRQHDHLRSTDDLVQRNVPGAPKENDQLALSWALRRLAKAVGRDGKLLLQNRKNPVDGELRETQIVEGHAVHRVDAAGQHRHWAVAERIGCIAVHAQGGLLAAMKTGLFQLTQQADGTLAAARVQAVEFPLPDMRFNDGRTDREGRFWVTSMVRNMAAASPAGALFRYAQGQFTATPVTGLRTGNGLGFSPDGRVMYLSDSHPTVQKIWAFDLDSDGQPMGQRLFVDMQQHPGRPDGAAVDADGCYWICGNDAGLVHRFTPDGRLDRSLAIPAAKPAMCALGGSRLDRLYVTTIAPAAPIPGYEASLAGAVFVLNPQCSGLVDTEFAG